eukprot:TRINITY_DN576_c0_g1_i3.p1 TRINITY_DN576_c0_g1~~TRINITY_DN576_c0_g1_i3.p1  ORF type:complete len:290 (+),score=73.08 TRINITY_DN576_c0_g1_i3:71-940(+)
MTLPNRPGYVVERRSEPKPQAIPNQHLSKPIETPPPPNIPNTPTYATSDQYFNTLFPFNGSGDDVAKIVDKSMNQELIRGSSIKSENPIKAEPMTPDDIQQRKNFVRSHRLLPDVIRFVTTCKKEGVSPSAETFAYLQDTNSHNPNLDFSLDGFLASPELEANSPDLEPDEEKSEEREDFLHKLNQLKGKYNEELDKLNRVCSEFCGRMFTLLKEQSTLRPISGEETSLKIQAIQSKFDFVKGQLRQNVCNAIRALDKQYYLQQKKRRSMPRKASDFLSEWFFAHLSGS